MLNVALLGAGRIGSVHAENITQNPHAKLTHVVDCNLHAAEALAAQYGARATENPRDVFHTQSVDAVVIASSTPTHIPFLKQGILAAKSILCEKPVALSKQDIQAALLLLQEHPARVCVGFNRRFDPEFAALRAATQDQRIHLLSITSRDPAPPPEAYERSCGGLFYDMSIHDFDMARWLLREDPIEVYAQASSFGASGLMDTAVITLKTASGALCQINNSRHASYGYDQRIEILANGQLLQSHRPPTPLGDRAFFIEHYKASYRLEMDHFIASTLRQAPLFSGLQDAQAALALAEAAALSLGTGSTVPCNQIFH